MTRRAALGIVVATGFLPPVGATHPIGGVREVAPGIFVRRGADEEATAANADAIGNAGFVIGRDAVCVTDPGGSLADGVALRRAIRARTERPITHVVLSHDHPDHLFGAAAFAADRPAFVGHHRLAASLAARGDYDRRRLAGLIGEAATGRLVAPTAAVRTPLAIDLGDRTLTVTAHEPAHTGCDLSLVDGASGILFAGDLLFVDRVPSLSGGSLGGWIALLTRWAAARAVPGHGPMLVDCPPAAARLLRYLTMLREDTRAAIKAGVPIETAAHTIGRSARGDWRLFDAYHAGNVIQAYKELEWE